VITAATLLGWLLALTCMGAVVVLRRELLRRQAIVARAGHELRGPLTAIRMVLHAAGRDREARAGGTGAGAAGGGAAGTGAPGAGGAAGGAEAWARWLAAIELEVDRARLALADLDGEPAPPRRNGVMRAAVPAPVELVDVGTLLRCQGAGWAAAALSVGRSVTIDAPRDGLIVRGDAARLAQAVGNLLANAMEHGDGAVVLAAAPAGRRVRIEVSDAGGGLGLPVERLLARSRAGRERRGHGLAVAAEAAERHGGRLITAPSMAGARLVLELPAAVLAEDAVPEAS
jgi:signal transduction histidine kinase